MPWTVLTERERARHRAREASERARGACEATIHSLIATTSALLRRRGTEDMAQVSRLITGAGHCVPCIGLITGLDARRVYGALERLKAETNVRLVSGVCGRCARKTTLHVIEP
jgi:hypothetical protein